MFFCQSADMLTWCRNPLCFKQTKDKQIQKLKMTRATFFVFRDIRKTFWENISKQKLFLYCWATFWQHFFCCGNKYQQKTTNMEKMGVVAFGRSNKFFLQIFYLSSCWRTSENCLACARGNTSENCLNIKKNQQKQAFC